MKPESNVWKCVDKIRICRKINSGLFVFIWNAAIKYNNSVTMY